MKYLKKTDAYRDSILIATDPCVDRSIVWAEKKIINGRVDSALVILSDLLKETPDSILWLYESNNWHLLEVPS